MLIIPAIDILDGNIVRLEKGDFSTAKSYFENPLDQIKVYDSHGFEWVHIVDLSGAKEGKITTFKKLEEIKKKTKLKIQFGGGIRSAEDINSLFAIGVDKVIIGSLPFVDRQEFDNVLRQIASDKIIIAADTQRGEVVERGWRENTSLEISAYIESCLENGLMNYLITDIDKDGMLEGPNLRLYKGLKEAFPGIYIIASGGIKEIGDLESLSLIDCDAVVVGKAIYENRIDLKELAKFDK